MKATQAQQQALLTLLGRIYTEIRAIEETYHIRARTDDFRPRIDYFHDTIRAYTEKASNGFERTGKLSVEALAADAAMLRQIKEKPLLRHPELQIPLSPETQIAHPPARPVTADTGRIDVSVANMLSEGYGHYALLFVALLAYPAERNYLNRLNEQQNEVDTLHDMIEVLLPKDMSLPADEETLLANVTNPELRKTLIAALNARKERKKAKVEEFLEVLQDARKSMRNEITALESAHMRYATSQLFLYQDAKHLVKKMAAQGLNIVGEFVENAVREAQRGGRGF